MQLQITSYNAVTLESGPRYFWAFLLWFRDGANCEEETVMIVGAQTAWPGH